MSKVIYTVCPLCGKKGVKRVLGGLFVQYERCKYCKHERKVSEYTIHTSQWNPVDGKWFKATW